VKLGNAKMGALVKCCLKLWNALC